MSKYLSTDARRAAARRIRFARYGLTPEQYDQMVAERKGCCDGCGRPEHLVVDHCHATKVVRGLLCYACNQALGVLRDDSATLRRLAEYLDLVR